MNNRPIKFRAWSLEYKQWMNHCSVIDSEGNILVLYYEQKEDGISPIVFDYPLDRVIIQQFTGLTDSTGKEIYGGDILAYKNGNFLKGKDGFDDRLEVFWDNENSKFGINFFSKHGGEGYTGKSEHLCSYSKETQIIGNIFETPELLA